MPHSIAVRSILLLALAATLLVYAHGLNGPFLFDDHIHITKNQWVKIESLSWPNLVQASNSSFSAFPSNRPLSQLSFGINHALAGLDPWAFKATNLAIHLLTGVLVFIFTRLAYRAVCHGTADQQRELRLALATAAVWLLHPLYVSTVLYSVQRMAQLSSLSLLVALSCYFWGRLQIAADKPGLGWILAAAPIALVGFLGKENTVLLPLLLLVSEITLLRGVPIANRQRSIRLIWALFIALPLIVGLGYIFTHLQLLSFDGRPFTLEERALTQPRVLWFYLRLLFIPDVTAFGLFHDDIQWSSGLLNPPSTAVAIIGLVGLTAAALYLRKRAPLFAFAVLFFLANHVLESTVFPLEMVFEHRNYLAGLGPLLYLVYLVIIRSEELRFRPLALALGGLLLVSYTLVTYVRVDNWSSHQNFILSAAENHPRSSRSNFMAGQLLISSLDKAGGNAPELADAARTFLSNGLVADPRCINCLFGLLVLDLHQNHPPDPAMIERLKETLRTGYVGPTKVSVSQFSYLVKWLQSGAGTMTYEDLESIFEAALENPQWNHTGRAGIEAAYRKYFEFVAQDLDAALQHAKAAVDAWPTQWSYHMQLVQVLQKLGRDQEALVALERAASVAANESQQQQTAEKRANITPNLPD
jgi:tetratricopeptide (TPR) repeat protein